MIHIERLHWISEVPLSTAQAQRLGEQLGQALEQAVSQIPGARQDGSNTLAVGTLTVRLPQQAVTNAAVFAQVATQTAQQLMNRVSAHTHPTHGDGP